MDQRLQLVVTAIHLVRNLATGLYESVGQRLMELIRNGVVACQRDPNVWEPKLAKIQILLVKNHPLGKGEPVLIVLDNGCGLDEVRLKRYFTDLGVPLNQLKTQRGGTHFGASQKGMGRLAGLALNEKCHSRDEQEAVKNGYYLFTRTERSGPV